MTESKFLVDFEYDLVQNREFGKPVKHPIFLNKLLVQNRGLFTSSASLMLMHVDVLLRPKRME